MLWLKYLKMVIVLLQYKSIKGKRVYNSRHSKERLHCMDLVQRNIWTDTISYTYDG